MRFFASLRYAQNDNGFDFGLREMEIVGRKCCPTISISLSLLITNCHSERSEESFLII